MSNALNPLPSLIRASSWDAANMQMRAAGRTVWNEDDFNHAAATQERLIRACYGRPADSNQSNMCFIRFGLAEAWEKAGHFKLKSNLADVNRALDEALAA